MPARVATKAAMDNTTAVASREVDVSCEIAFHAWAEPEEFARWAGTPKHLWAPAIDGLWFFEAERDGKSHAHYGRFLKIHPPRELLYTWMSGGTKGNDSRVAVQFESLGATRTKLTVTHSGLPDEQSAKAHEAGWVGNLARFADYIATR